MIRKKSHAGRWDYGVVRGRSGTREAWQDRTCSDCGVGPGNLCYNKASMRAVAKGLPGAYLKKLKQPHAVRKSV